jgi:hypothetical protein
MLNIWRASLARLVARLRTNGKVDASLVLVKYSPSAAVWAPYFGLKRVWRRTNRIGEYIAVVGQVGCLLLSHYRLTPIEESLPSELHRPVSGGTLTFAGPTLYVERRTLDSFIRTFSLLMEIARDVIWGTETQRRCSGPGHRPTHPI